MLYIKNHPIRIGRVWVLFVFYILNFALTLNNIYFIVYCWTWSEIFYLKSRNNGLFKCFVWSVWAWLIITKINGRMGIMKSPSITVLSLSMAFYSITKALFNRGLFEFNLKLFGTEFQITYFFLFSTQLFLQLISIYLCAMYDLYRPGLGFEPMILCVSLDRVFTCVCSSCSFDANFESSFSLYIILFFLSLILFI